MSFIDKYTQIIGDFIQNSDKPIVVFSALWPMMRLMDCSPLEAPQFFLNTLIDTIGTQRSLLMPAFAHGYQNGLCNLDTAISKNGVLSEQLRKSPGVRRTLSAFFSYCIWDPNQTVMSKVINLMPKFAWGDGSVYEWMEQENVHFIMLGAHPTTCSYLHRLEWLAREKINYRYNKLFRGRLIRDSKIVETEEIVFVRSLQPEAINDFTILYEYLRQQGMDVVTLEGVSIAHMRALEMKNAVLPVIQRDALIFLKNKDAFKESTQ